MCEMKSFNFFGLAGSKHEDAMEMYKQAASQFHIAQNWEKSTECYMLAAELAEKVSEQRSLSHCMRLGIKTYVCACLSIHLYLY